PAALCSVCAYFREKKSPALLSLSLTLSLCVVPVHLASIYIFFSHAVHFLPLLSPLFLSLSVCVVFFLSLSIFFFLTLSIFPHCSPLSLSLSLSLFSLSLSLSLSL